MVRAMMEADLPTKPHTRRNSPEEPWRPRPAKPTLSQPAFNCNAPDMYVELLNFEMEVANVLHTIAYDLSNKVNVPSIKDWLGREGLQFIQTLTLPKKMYTKVQQDCSMY